MRVFTDVKGNIDMERLWSPWRLEYILADKDESCIFCQAIEENADERNLVLHRGESCFIILNRYPYNNGHLMIVPYEHVDTLEGLPEDALSELMLMINKGIALLRETMCPDGFNVGMNLGRSAGAGIAEHVHIHIVPRWEGDTSFMAVTTGTRTIPEVLGDTYQKLKDCLEKAQSIERT